MVFIVIIIAAYLLQMFLPWWVIIIISFITCALIGKTGKIALWSPFFAILLLWIAIALYKSIPNGNVLAGRISEMLGLSAWWQVLLITSILGAFVAAISGFCGYHFRKSILALKKKE